MKTLITTIAAGLLAISFAVPASAVPSKHTRAHMAEMKASCKAEAAKKFSAIHLIKRRNFTNDCMAQHASAKPKTAMVRHAAKPKTQPTTTGQSAK